MNIARVFRPCLAVVLALALSSVAAPVLAGPGAVTDVHLQSPSYATDAGKCTTTVTFTGSISANGPVTVGYHWEFSDGATLAPATIDFAEAGVEIVSIAWTLTAPFDGWVRLHVDSPTPIVSLPAAFKTGCAPPQPPVPQGPKQGRFLVTLNGYSVNHETYDDILERDGARDEVSWVPYVYEVDVSGSLRRVLWSDAFSSVMGQRRRPDSPVTLAGTATPTGGLRTGDAYPSATPWLRTSGPAPGLNLPAVMFDGTLARGVNAAAIFPTLWEWDAPEHMYLLYLDSMLGYRPTVVSAVAALITAPPTTSLGSYLVPGSALGVGVTTAMGDGPLGTGEVGFRPIGMQRSGDGWVFTPASLVLTYDGADYISRTDFGRGRGVVEVRYIDHQVLAGDYSIYLQVERLP